MQTSTRGASSRPCPWWCRLRGVLSWRMGTSAHISYKLTYQSLYFMPEGQFYALAIIDMYRLCPHRGVSLNLRDCRRACSLGLSRRLKLRAQWGAKACTWFSFYWDSGYPYWNPTDWLSVCYEIISKKWRSQENAYSPNKPPKQRIFCDNLKII